MNDAATVSKALRVRQRHIPNAASPQSTQAHATSPAISIATFRRGLREPSYWRAEFISLTQPKWERMILFSYNRLRRSMFPRNPVPQGWSPVELASAASALAKDDVSHERANVIVK